MTTPQLTGACNCGAVKIEISEPLIAALYCHCTRCQRRTGTAAQASAMAVPGSVRVVAGEEELGRWTVADGKDKVFCSRCGSHLYAEYPGGDQVAVRLGIIDGDPGVRPSARQFVAYAAPWEPIPEDGLPRFDERVPAQAPPD
jgi:hypothetical protein